MWHGFELYECLLVLVISVLQASTEQYYSVISVQPPHIPHLL